MTLLHRLPGLVVAVARLVMVAVVTILVVQLAPPASAENPLYCNGTYPLNQGCGKGPTGTVRLNEAKNENGGCVTVQFWTSEGYSKPFPACGGIATQETSRPIESYPRCWNSTNAKDLIHCRYALWSN